MNKENIWLLFKNTGKIEYYLIYKKLCEEEHVREVGRRSH